MDEGEDGERLADCYDIVIDVNYANFEEDNEFFMDLCVEKKNEQRTSRTLSTNKASFYFTKR